MPKDIRLEGNSLEAEYLDFEKLAKKEYPDISEQMEVYTATRIEIENYEAYLNLINETPTVVTANSAT